MNPKFLLAIDQGTSSSRTVIYDHDANVVATEQQEFPQLYPRPGWVEHDPEAIWSSVEAVTRGAMEKAGANAADISAIGITNQRETTVIWDRETGEPVFNAIVWQDSGSIRISRVPRLPGFSITWTAFGRVPRRASLLSAPSTAFSCGA